MKYLKFFSRGRRNGTCCLRVCARGGIVLIVLLVLAAPTAAQNGSTTRQGGDTIATAIIIPDLPFSDTGTTTGYVNDYNESCGFPIEMAPDVVYSYTPAVDLEVEISLCGSSYSTKVYVYEDTWTPGSTIACNTWYCSDNKSFIWRAPMSAGHTYYIVIDGKWAGSSGDYVLNVIPREECGWCPPDANFHENEEICHYGYIDWTNGGCSEYADQDFGTVNPGDVFCGTSGTYLDYYGYNHPDTDWFELTLPYYLNEVTFNCTAEFPLKIMFIDAGSGDCSDDAILNIDYAEPCDTATITTTVPGGEYYLWIGPEFEGGVPCGVAWVADVTVIPPEFFDTVAVDLNCYNYSLSGPVPASGPVPFTTQMQLTLENQYPGSARRIAARINVTIGNGSSYSNWRSGWRDIGPGYHYGTYWNQTIPALRSVIGDNVFTLEGEDVTTSPLNQPPYPPSGDTDTDTCTVTAIAP